MMNGFNIRNAFIILLCIAWAPIRSEQGTTHPPGLSVENGILCKAGKPYRGMGVNYFNLFYRTLKDSSDKSYEKGLTRLSEAGIPFARFMCCGFWPIDWDLYLRDKEAYFKRLDEVIQAAEKNHVGLIPSLFWYMPTVPDIVGEPMDQLGNPKSKTIAFIKQYTRETVMRYKDSPAIWAWEFGNEYNLQADLPNAAQHRPPVWPKLKTAHSRTQRDELASRHMLTALAEFAKTVRSIDRHRIIITGNSIPRPSAYHNTKEKSWKEDSPEQFKEILLRDNPDPFNTLSVHIYPVDKNKYSAGAKSLKDLIKTVEQISRKAKKPLFIGEFGTPVKLGQEKERAVFQELIGAIENNNVPLSALWVYDFPQQDKDWNVTFENDRAYMLELVAKANSRMQ